MISQLQQLSLSLQLQGLRISAGYGQKNCPVRPREFSWSNPKISLSAWCLRTLNLSCSLLLLTYLVQCSPLPSSANVPFGLVLTPRAKKAIAKIVLIFLQCISFKNNFSSYRVPESTTIYHHTLAYYLRNTWIIVVIRFYKKTYFTCITFVMMDSCLF